MQRFFAFHERQFFGSPLLPRPSLLCLGLFSSVASFPAEPAFTGKNQSPETAPPFILTPALPFAAKPGQPVLLASDLQPDRREDSQVFRGAELESRLPQPAGSIVSIEDGLAAIDLGSLDGLAKGSELRIFRDERSTQPIGRLMVTTVFRERARGRILSVQEIHREQPGSGGQRGIFRSSLGARGLPRRPGRFGFGSEDC